MTNGDNLTLTGDDVVQAMSTASNQSLVETHNELKAKYLESNLSNDLKDKPVQKQVKL